MCKTIILMKNIIEQNIFGDTKSCFMECFIISDNTLILINFEMRTIAVQWSIPLICTDDLICYALEQFTDNC